jgi:hypothetical protein
MHRSTVCFALLASVAISAGCSRQRTTLAIAEPDSAPSTSPAADPERSPPLPSKEPDGGELSVFASDFGSKLLAERLPPTESLPGLASDKKSERLHFPTPDSLNGLKLRVPPSQALMPSSRLALPPAKVHGQPLPEGVPLAYNRAEPLIPERAQLPAGELVHVASVDLSAPLPLPIMASPVSEPLTSDDATNEFSLSAALAATPPARLNPAPFLRLSIPDPYEHHAAARLARSLPELWAPVTESPRPPK